MGESRGTGLPAPGPTHSPLLGLLGDKSLHVGWRQHHSAESGLGVLVAALTWFGHQGWHWGSGSPLTHPWPLGLPEVGNMGQGKASVTLTLGFPSVKPGIQYHEKRKYRCSLALPPCPGIPQSFEVCPQVLVWGLRRKGCVWGGTGAQEVPVEVLMGMLGPFWCPYGSTFSGRGWKPTCRVPGPLPP